MINTFVSFFAIGTFGFWALLITLSIIYIATIENEYYTLPALLTVGTILLYWKDISAADIGWPAIAAFFVIYTAIGIGYSVFRFFRYVKLVVEKSSEETSKEDLEYKIGLSRNKSKITAWIIAWPWSLAWNITGDFFNMIYESISGVYQKVIDNALEKFPTSAEIRAKHDKEREERNGRR